MASEFLDEEEAADHADPRAGDAPQSLRRAIGAWWSRGCAGSGKTMLAVEQAKRLAREGPGRALRLLQPRAARPPADARGEVRGRVPELPRPLRAARPPSRGRAPEHPEDDTPPEFWDEELPERAGRGDRRARAAVRRAVRRRGPGPREPLARGADAARSRDPDEDLVWLFMDANQRVYEARLDVPKEFRPFDLTVNCRNTQAIAPRGA